MIAPMSIDAIGTVAVLGAGTMGNGVAHVFARAGYTVILRDVEQRFLDRGLETISKNLDREVKKEKITAAEKPPRLRGFSRRRIWGRWQPPNLPSRPFPSSSI